MFKAVQALHKEGWNIEVPSVKQHVALKGNVAAQDACSALQDAVTWHLQRNGWVRAGQDQLLQDSALHPSSGVQEVQSVTLTCEASPASGAVFQVGMHALETRKFSPEHLLQGDLARRWQQASLDGPALTQRLQASPLLREVNSALRGCPCKLLPDLMCAFLPGSLAEITMHTISATRLKPAGPPAGPQRTSLAP